MVWSSPLGEKENPKWFLIFHEPSAHFRVVYWFKSELFSPLHQWSLECDRFWTLRKQIHNFCQLRNDSDLKKKKLLSPSNHHWPPLSSYFCFIFLFTGKCEAIPMSFEWRQSPEISNFRHEPFRRFSLLNPAWRGRRTNSSANWSCFSSGEFLIVIRSETVSLVELVWNFVELWDAWLITTSDTRKPDPATREPNAILMQFSLTEEQVATLTCDWFHS